MTLSTGFFFDRASQQMVRGQQKVADLQTQLATGLKVGQPSDAPEQASTLQRLRSVLVQQKAHQDNLSRVAQRLETQDTVLQNASGLLTRLRELSIQYGNGTLSAEQRRIAAVEVRGLRDQLLSLANSRDAEGFALFGGTRVQGDPYTPEGTYEGDQTQTDVPIGRTEIVSNRLHGSAVFVSVLRDTEPAGFFTVLDDLAGALEANRPDAVQRGIGEVSALQQGITLALADVGSDRNLVQSQADSLDTQIVRIQSLQSDLQDVDYAQAVTELQKQIMSLEAAQSSFAQVAKLSLFNYLG